VPGLGQGLSAAFVAWDRRQGELAASIGAADMLESGWDAMTHKVWPSPQQKTPRQELWKRRSVEKPEAEFSTLEIPPTTWDAPFPTATTTGWMNSKNRTFHLP
jgi:hypothetical protein